VHGFETDACFTVLYDESCANYELARQDVEDVHFYNQLGFSFHAHRLRHAREVAKSELEWLKLQLSSAVTDSQSPEYTALREQKALLKEQLRNLRRYQQKQLRGAEADLASHPYAESKCLKLYEALNETSSKGQERVREMEESLNQRRKELEYVVQEAKSRSEKRAESEEFVKMQAAKTAFKQAAAEKVDVSMAKTTVEKIGSWIQMDDKNRNVGKLEKIVNKIEEALDIERIELTGSLRDLVLKGCPLTAEVTVVIMKKRSTFTVDYNLADAAGLVSGIVESTWKALKDVFDDDDE
jgi:exonuclease VII small subunit